jgi:hypothetical protein
MNNFNSALLIDDKIYDQHTMYLITSVATERQLDTAFRQAMAQVESDLNQKFDCKYRINIVRDKSNKTLQFGYLWVSNSQIYHMLIGNNPDGTPRRVAVPKELDSSLSSLSIEDIDLNAENPRFSSNENKDPITQPLSEVSSSEDNPLLLSSRSQSWSAIAEEEDEQEARNLSKTSSEETYVNLPPLMTLPKFKFTEEQIKEHQLDSEYGEFDVHQAFVFPLDDKKSRNRLVSRKIPIWVTEAMIKQAFSVFASNPDKVVQVRVKKQATGSPKGENRNPQTDKDNEGFTQKKGKKEKRAPPSPKWIDDHYPLVEIKDAMIEGRWAKVVIVTYDPLTHDAQFALLMNKKISLVNRTTNRAEILHFSHASCNE